jgi:hypothetical protein
MGCAQREPDLNDLIADPIVQAVMRRDAVKEQELRGLIERVRLSLGADLMTCMCASSAEEHCAL